jgi:hypothetical protein
MPVSDLHRQVAGIALRAAAEHGFALGGGNALIAHGVIDRVTQDIDLFTDEEHGVEAAAGAVEVALRAAVTAPGRAPMLLQMAYFDRSARPVIMEFGPVLDLEDVVGGKVCALASRAVPRDYLDTAAALDRYTVAELISFAKRLDPGLTDQDFADAGRRLDLVDDGWFASLGLTPRELAALRERFAAWPRTQ